MRPTFFFPAVFGAAVALSDFEQKCTALVQDLKLDNFPGATVTIAEYLRQDAVIDQFAEGTNATCTLPNPVVPVDLCRVALRVPTSNASEIYMEAWLPEHWNTRLMSVGNGGLGGCIIYQDHMYVTSRGFATISSDAGHSGPSAGAFDGQPEVLKDFSWRAMYTATTVGKEITTQFYETPQKQSYFFGCSQGGRQGIKAAQVNPDLFDGIIAAAPGLRLPGLFSHAARWLRTIGTDVANLTISTEQWSAVQNETLRQCDKLDGATDGIVEDSRRCKPNLSKLKCKNSGGPETCLSSKDISTVEKFFTPWVVDDTVVYHGMAHNGDELTHATTLSSPEFLSYALEWPRYVSRQDASWTLDQWSPADAALAVQQNFFGFNTFDGDLSEFRESGGKLLHYHGVVDQSIDSTVSDAYYQQVSKTLRAAPAELDEFYRYFHISGLQHCNGGPGAFNVGQGSTPPPASEDPEDNVLSRIVAWVEEGDAPETMRGTKYVNNDAAQGVDFARKHCRYPLKNLYVGKGDGKDEAGWRCVK